MRKLASIQKIVSLTPIPNADRIEYQPVIFDMSHACDVIRTNVGVCRFCDEKSV